MIAMKQLMACVALSLSAVLAGCTPSGGTVPPVETAPDIVSFQVTGSANGQMSFVLHGRGLGDARLGAG